MKKIITSILLAVMLITGCGEVTAKEPVKEPVKQVTEVPEYNGNAYTVMSGMQKDLFFCRLPNGIYKITSDANDEQKWV